MTEMKRFRRAFILLAILLPVMLVLAACQDDSDDETVDDVPSPTEEPAADPPTPEPTVSPPEDEPVTDDDTDIVDEPTVTPGPTAEATEPPATEITDDDDMDETGMGSVRVYLVRNEEIAVASRDIAGTPEVATGAINELLTGTTPYEEDLGFSSEIPMETRLLGISIQDDATAIVDLTGDFESGGGSFSMQMRAAQIVFTLTQFNTIDQVQIRIDGTDVDAIGGEGLLVDQPLTRNDFEDLSPAILVESPAPGAEVSSPINLRGTSNTFEATMQYEIIDSTGEVIYEDFGTATSGSGTRGEFDFEFDVPIENEGFGMIVVFEYSAQDGSRINVIEIPVDLRR